MAALSTLLLVQSSFFTGVPFGTPVSKLTPRTPRPRRAVLAAAAPEANLSVGELKKLLSDRGVDFRDCLEKADLVRALNEASGRAAAASAPPPPAAPAATAPTAAAPAGGLL